MCPSAVSTLIGRKYQAEAAVMGDKYQKKYEEQSRDGCDMLLLFAAISSRHTRFAGLMLSESLSSHYQDRSK